MSTSLEALGLLPRKPVNISVVDREAVRSVIHAERKLVSKAIDLGMDAEEVHRGWAPYIEQLRAQLSADAKAEFDRFFIEESLINEDLDKSYAKLAEAQQQYAEVSPSTKKLSTARIFFAGVNTTILIGIALYWAFR